MPKNLPTREGDDTWWVPDLTSYQSLIIIQKFHILKMFLKLNTASNLES